MSYYIGEQFPVLGKGNEGWCIPFKFVLEHARQCQLNHCQTPQRLRERGGLCWSELYAVLNDQKWAKLPEDNCRNAVLRMIMMESKRAANEDRDAE